jgi:hypothetical protein
MKNILVIDGADNATHSVFQATDEEFAAIFAGTDQDIEIVEDFVDRQGERAQDVLRPIWDRPILKHEAQGIHGTLYFGYAGKRHFLPASKREADWDRSAINLAQREHFAKAAALGSADQG